MDYPEYYFLGWIAFKLRLHCIVFADHWGRATRVGRDGPGGIGTDRPGYRTAVTSHRRQLPAGTLRRHGTSSRDKTQSPTVTGKSGVLLKKCCKVLVVKYKGLTYGTEIY